MDNRNTFSPTQQPNGYYPYLTYPAAMPAYARPEATPYMLPQSAAAASLKGRPVSSFEEARVAQIDLDGSIAFFPDLGNKKIYTKRINADGTAAINTYTLDSQPAETTTEYATKAEIQEVKSALDELLSKLKGAAPQNQPAAKSVLNF